MTETFIVKPNNFFWFRKSPKMFNFWCMSLTFFDDIGPSQKNLNVNSNDFRMTFTTWKCPNMQFFLVRIFLYSDRKKLRIWTLFTQWKNMGTQRSYVIVQQILKSCTKTILCLRDRANMTEIFQGSK